MTCEMFAKSACILVIMVSRLSMDLRNVSKRLLIDTSSACWELSAASSFCVARRCASANSSFLLMRSASAGSMPCLVKTEVASAALCSGALGLRASLREVRERWLWSFRFSSSLLSGVAAGTLINVPAFAVAVFGCVPSCCWELDCCGSFGLGGGSPLRVVDARGAASGVPAALRCVSSSSSVWATFVSPNGSIVKCAAFLPFSLFGAW